MACRASNALVKQYRAVTCIVVSYCSILWVIGTNVLYCRDSVVYTACGCKLRILSFISINAANLVDAA